MLPSAAPRRLGLGLLFLLPHLACASPGEASCQQWAEARCARLWMCTVEHSRSTPGFLALYGATPEACQALQAPRCEAVAPCVSAPEAAQCRLAAALALCVALDGVCAPACG
jgi:hypothetical protein